MPAHERHDLVSFQYSFLTKSPYNQTAKVRHRVSDAINARWVISVYKQQWKEEREGCTHHEWHEILLASRYIKRHELAVVNKVF